MGKTASPRNEMYWQRREDKAARVGHWKWVESEKGSGLFDLSQEFNVPLVDIRSLVEQQTPDGIPGSEWLVDHVHPSIEGHQLIADALFENLVSLQFFPQPAPFV